MAKKISQGNLNVTNSAELLSYVINQTPILRENLDLPVQGEDINPIGKLIMKNATYWIIGICIAFACASCSNSNFSKRTVIPEAEWAQENRVAFDVPIDDTLNGYVFGIGHWRWLPCTWALIPFVNIINFAVCPIETLTEDGKEMSIGKLFKTPIFLLGIVLMVCAGSSEIAMGQWFSAFAESAIGMQKTTGDLVGPCLFAVAMGISRIIYGKFGNKLDLTKYMLGSGALCLACYLAASLSKSPMVCLLGCIICGFSVGIMWPGTISILSKRLPRGGTAMFAFLAMAGDLGGALGPGIVGFFAQMNNDDLKKGVLAGAVFPLVLVISVAGILIKVRKERKNKG